MAFYFWNAVFSVCHTAIYVFLFWKLRGLSPNFHIHVSVSDLYIPRKGSVQIFSFSRIGRSIVGINKSPDTWMWKLGLWPRNSFSGSICFEFSVSLQCNKEVTTDLEESWPSRHTTVPAGISYPLHHKHSLQYCVLQFRFKNLRKMFHNQQKRLF